MKSDLNYILEEIISAIEEKILPSIENVIASNREAKIQNGIFGQMDSIRTEMYK